MSRMDPRHQGVSRPVREAVDGRKTSRHAAYGAGTSDKLPHRALQAARTTPSDRQATRFTNIAPKRTSATRFSPEEDFSATSFSCSPTPDYGASSPELAREFSDRLSLDAESFPTAPVAYDADNWKNVPSSGRSGHNNNSRTTTYATQGVYNTSGQLVSSAPQKGRQAKANRTGGDDGDDEQGRQNHRSKRKAEGDLEGFPCPYWRRFPRRSLQPSCRRSNFGSIPRLKEHLRRVHYNESLCSRCYVEVRDLHQHARMNPPCRINPDACPLEFGDDQNSRLQDKMRNKTDMEKWCGIWSILFHGFDQNNIPPPNATEDMSTQQRHNLINNLQQYISSSLAGWEEQLVQQAEQGCSPAADGEVDIPWIMASLRNRLDSIFRDYRNSHASTGFEEVNATEGAQTAMHALQGQPSYHPGISSSHVLPVDSFASGEDSSQPLGQGQTTTLADVQIQNIHNQLDNSGMNYPIQSPQNDLSADPEAFDTWFPNHTNQYDGFYDESDYNNR